MKRKRAIASAVSKPLFRTIVPLARRRGLGGTACLLYHEAERERFRRHVRYFKHHYDVISLATLVDGIRSGSVPENAVVLTFDDGYRTLYDQVFPVIKEEAVPVSVFVPSAYLDTLKIFWWDKVRLIRRHGGEIADPSSLKDLSERKRRNRIDAAFDESYRDRERYVLSAAEAREMQASGYVDFHSHSRTHPILPTQSASEAHSEIVDSKQELEEKLDTTVDTFAYPDGAYDSEHAEMVRDAGYQAGFSTIPGINTARVDPYQIRRLLWAGVRESSSSTISFNAAPLPLVATCLHGLLRRATGKSFPR